MVALTSQSSPDSTTPADCKPSTGNESSSTAATSSTGMNATDGLHMMREGPEATVKKLRAGLHELEQRDATAKTALAKSDAIILELRSNVRTLKRQCENLEREKAALERETNNLEGDLEQLESLAHQEIQKCQDEHAKEVLQLQSQLKMSASPSHSGVIGELQVQLDRAHAQLLTADMVRKELEDTLEAEQYTWELRVQDQDRQHSQLMDECTTLKQDLDQCRSQWKEAEIGWTKEIQGLSKELESTHRELNHSNKNGYAEMQEKLSVLESERSELQGCLDEAMQELEAVDQEMRTSPNVQERLHNLYKWLQENSGQAEEETPTDVDQLLDGIYEMMEYSIGTDHSNNSKEIQELKAQVSVYRGDLKAREESSAELRMSLKEAVALLKPLQDAVHKTDMEKQTLEQELIEWRSTNIRTNDNDSNLQIIDDLQNEIKSLQQKLSSVSPERTSKSLSFENKESSSAAKKRQQEEALQQLLASTQTRFQELNETNFKMVAENEALQQRFQNEEVIQELERELRACEVDLKRKDEEVMALREELSRRPHDYGVEPVEHERRTELLEIELDETRQELIEKTEAERILSKSLKEALSLLKPLQVHLETAEREKKNMHKQMKLCKKRLALLENGRTFNDNVSVDHSRSSGKLSGSEEIEQHAKDLENRLIAADTLKEDFVELNARYNDTQSKLESTMMQQHALVETLKQREEDEKGLLKGLSLLRDKLAKSEHELENAKYIATSALMKVEELTMDDVHQMSIEHQTGLTQSDTVTLEDLRLKVRLLEREVESAKELNGSLETSIQERDSILQTLAEQHSATRVYDDDAYQSPHQNVTKQINNKGVTWDNNWER